MGNTLARRRAADRPPSYQSSVGGAEKDLQACIERRKRMVLWAREAKNLLGAAVAESSAIKEGAAIEVAFAIFMRQYHVQGAKHPHTKTNLRDEMFILMGLPLTNRSGKRPNGDEIMSALIRFGEGYFPPVDWLRSGRPYPDKSALAACIERRQAGVHRVVTGAPLETANLTVVESEFLRSLRERVTSVDEPIRRNARDNMMVLMGLPLKGNEHCVAAAIVRFAQGYAPRL